MLTFRHVRFAGLIAMLAAAVALAAPAQLLFAGQDKTEAKPDDKKAEAKKPDDTKKADDKKADGKKVKSTIKVTVPSSPYEDEFKPSPSSDAVLKIEDQVMKPKGTTREFITPEIDAGKEYEYKFTTVFGPNNYTMITRTKTVVFKAGDPVVVDLTKPDPKFPDAVKIRWVPTPDDIVDKMIGLAGVKEGDIVYEPGPGDGKVLIAATKKGAKKAVGIELDPKKVAEAQGKVKDAKLDDKITIRQGDALKADYSEANVIFMYMGDDFGREIGPLLLKQCKPGTRIVSHRFLLGDWKPDRTEKVTGADGDEYELHVWTVPKK